MDDPWKTNGGLAILQGNLAPNTAVTKPAAIVPEMHTFEGAARCFDSEESANQAILEGRVKEGDVMVIRYEGPKEGPGMREMYNAMKLLYGRGLALKEKLSLVLQWKIKEGMALGVFVCNTWRTLPAPA